MQPIFHSFHSTKSEVQKTQSTDSDQEKLPTGPILSSITTGVLRAEAMFHLHQLS